MNRITTLTVAALTLLVYGCSGIEVKQDYDTAADFASLNRYAWMPDDEDAAAGGQVENSELINRRIREAVNTTLVARGYRKTTGANADFLVGYQYKVREKTDRRDRSRTGVGFGVGTGSHGSFGSIGIGIGLGGRDREYDEGVLTIDVVTPDGKKLIWRGMAEQRLVWNNDPRKTTERINKVVRAVLEQFPPR